MNTATAILAGCVLNSRERDKSVPPTNTDSTATRVTLTAMAMGEAAAKKNPQEVGGVKVREALKASGAGPFTDA